MPQFQLVNFLPQLAWLTLFFAILYFGIVRATLPRIGRVVDGRERMVKDDIAAAEAAKAEADRVREAYERAMAQARGTAHDAVAEAQAGAARASEARLHEAGAATGTLLDDAMRGIAAERTRASGEVARIAADAAAEIVERVSGARPDTAAAAAAVARVA